jgi:NADH-quinone oxidoreductase subunit D
MSITSREFQSPDTAARTAEAAAAYQLTTEDLVGEKLTLNMGPSHPATHGVLRIILELDGEVITKGMPELGYLHRGDEKIAENNPHFPALRSDPMAP